MASVRKPAPSASPKAAKLKDLGAKTVVPKKAGAVKGGGAPTTPGWGKNHNQSFR
jgi:hypothetical protein